MGHEAFANIIPSSLSISMTTVKSKTDRVTFISQKSDWLGLGPIKEVKMNKTLDVVQFYFEDGSIGEVHACNSGGLVFSPIVNVDSGLKALDVPRLDRASEVLPQAVGDEVTGSDRSSDSVELALNLLCDALFLDLYENGRSGSSVFDQWSADAWEDHPGAVANFVAKHLKAGRFRACASALITKNLDYLYNADLQIRQTSKDLSEW